MSLTHKEIRFHILEILYNYAEENPNDSHMFRELFFKGLQNAVGKEVPAKPIDFNMIYLANHHLVNIRRTGPSWISAEITAHGIDAYENPEKSSKTYPFMKVNIQNIYGDHLGDTHQNIDSQVNYIQKINDSFKQVYETLEMKKDIPPQKKKDIRKNSDLLKDELKKNKPDAGKIQRLWEWLKSNAKWVIPLIKDVVLEGKKKA